jgi:hypothetical protein
MARTIVDSRLREIDRYIARDDRLGPVVSARWRRALAEIDDRLTALDSSADPTPPTPAEAATVGGGRRK